MLRRTVYLLFVWLSLGPASADYYPINFCKTFGNVCQWFQASVGNCPIKNIQDCESTVAGVEYSTFVGGCTCGYVDAHSRIMENIINYEVDKALSSAVVLTSKDTIELCATYSNACNTFMKSIACPGSAQKNVGCDTPNDYSTFQGQCQCGAIDASEDIKQELVTYELQPHMEEWTSSGGLDINVDVQNGKFCTLFQETCDKFLSNIQCPGAKTSQGCTKENDYSTWTGQCGCGSIDVSEEVVEAMFDKLAYGQVETNIVTRGADGSVDICTSFTDSCSFWLQALLCDAEEVNDNNCVGSGQETDEVLTAKYGKCSCGKLDVGMLIEKMIIDAQVVADIPSLTCQGAKCHHPKVLVPTGTVSAGGIFGILFTMFVLVVAAGNFAPYIFTCGAKDA